MCGIGRELGLAEASLPIGAPAVRDPAKVCIVALHRKIVAFYSFNRLTEALPADLFPQYYSCPRTSLQSHKKSKLPRKKDKKEHPCLVKFLAYRSMAI